MSSYSYSTYLGVEGPNSGYGFVDIHVRSVTPDRAIEAARSVWATPGLYKVTTVTLNPIRTEHTHTYDCVSVETLATLIQGDAEDFTRNL